MSLTGEQAILLSEVQIFVLAKKAADERLSEQIRLLEAAIFSLRKLGAHPEFVDVLEHDLAAAKEAARSPK